MEGGGREGNIAEGQTLKRLMEKTFPASLRRKRCKHVDRIDECVCVCFFLEVASALLYIKTLHISVSLVLLQPLSGVNVTRENIDREVECGAESAAHRFFKKRRKKKKTTTTKSAFDTAAPLIINSPP